MLAGTALSLFFFQDIREGRRRVAEAEQRVVAVVRINNDLVTLMSRLHRAADKQRPGYFESEAARLLAGFQANRARAAEALRQITPATGQEVVVAGSFIQMLDELPARVSSLIELARAGDSLALHARVTDQVDHTDDVGEALMRQADSALANAQRSLSDQIDEAERRAVTSLIAGSLLALIAAALLGILATRGITEPLTRLNAAAGALARGEFHQRVGLSGNNELADLGRSFDHTAQELAKLYEKARKSEEQLRLIADSLPVLIAYVDREHRYIFSNEQHEQWFSRSRDQLTGARVEDVMDNSAYRSFREGLERASNGQSVTYETTLHHSMRGERNVRTIVVPDLGEHKEIRGFVSLVEDITADRQVEAALRASEERLQEMLAQENEARRTAELLNQVSRVFSAELNEEKLAQSLTDVATQLVEAQFSGLFLSSGTELKLQACTGASPDELEHLGRLRSTPLWPLMNSEPVRIADISRHPVYVASLKDTTGYRPIASYLAVPVISRTGETFGTLVFGHERPNAFSPSRENLIRALCAEASIALHNAHLFKRLNSANAALQKSNRALQHANDDLNVFAFSASHDLQEPLRNISLYGQLLQRRYRDKLEPQASEFISYLVEGAGRMSELIRDLLAYMQASNLHVEATTVVPAADAVKKALAALDSAIRASGATISCGDLPGVAVERVHLQQLFQNLLSNAIKYRSEKPPHVVISASDSGSHWEFSVKDNGLGVDPQYSQQIFKPFKRLHGRTTHSGTGIGLAICQKIADRYGGRIWVESQPGKGSDFRFTLPKSMNG